MTYVLEQFPERVNAEDCRLRSPINWAPVITKQSSRQLRTLTILAALAAVWYLVWLFQPERIGNRLLYGLLALAEIFNVIQAAGFWWTVSANRHKRRVRERKALPASTTVDVLIPTYSEPVEIVEATVAAACEMDGYKTRIWLLDDGDRAEMEALARSYDVGYIAREQHEGAKAGNINHALGSTSSEFVLILDCDHVPLSHFLRATLPDLADENVAFVQTPQYYANFENGPIAAAAWSQQAIFFGAIAQGKDGHDAMFCCGTNVVFRRSALESVGGFPTTSLTEDFELSIRLHERGWKTTYVEETLASGLAPEDMASYVSQQHRWARGCLSAFPRILTARLPIRLRLQYLLSSMYFLSGFTLLLYMLFPVLRINFGVQPLAGTSADQFLLHFVPFYALCLLMLMTAGERSFTFSALALAQSNFWIHMHALFRLLLRRPGRFVVTAKQGSSDRQMRAVLIPLIMVALLAGSAVYGLARGADPGTLNNVAFAFMHVIILLAGLWPALVTGHGKKDQESVIDLTDTPRTHLKLVPSVQETK